MARDRVSHQAREKVRIKANPPGRVPVRTARGRVMDLVRATSRDSRQTLREADEKASAAAPGGSSKRMSRTTRKAAALARSRTGLALPPRRNAVTAARRPHRPTRYQ